MSKSRLETFSDGVFAIVITLLVLTIAQPKNYNDLGHEYADRWPALVVYAVTFVVIGIMWLNHHTLMNHFVRVDRGLFYCNLLLLLTVVFIPYPTGIFGEALRLGEGEKAAAVAYSIAMALNAYAWGAMWLYGSTNRRLLIPEFPEDQRRPATRTFLLGSVVYTAAIGVALISALRVPCVPRPGCAVLRTDPLARRTENAGSSP